MADLDQLHAVYYEASRALARGHWDALVAKLRDQFPDAVRFETTGSYEEIGGDLLVHVSKVLDAAGEEMPWDWTGVEFEEVILEHLNWLGTVAPDEYEGVHVHDIDSGYAYVKLVAVLRLSRRYQPDDILAILPAENPFGGVVFVATDPGYDGEFDDLGADPTSWEPV